MTVLTPAVARAEPVLRPWMAVAALLLACAAKGVLATAGLEVPPDPDTVRDLGFVQGFLDGNWFGDPATPGAWRWYPPLLHALAASASAGLRIPALALWLHAGTWVNLLTPLAFYLMNRRLIGPWPAAFATVALVLLTGLASPGDASIGYAPWTLTPAMAWPMFFAAAWLIAAATPGLRALSAVAVGSALGLVFLAHTVPAVLLSAMAAAAAVTAGGWRRRTLLWLAAVAATQALWAAPFLWPLLRDYDLHIANAAPGAWVHPALTDPRTLLPNLCGAALLALFVARRGWRRLPPMATALTGTWIGACLLALARHYLCSAIGSTGGACGVFVIAPHHYHAYLQAGWATLAGLALASLPDTPRHRAICLAAAAAALSAFFDRPEDRAYRSLASADPDLVLDRAAYRWILAGTAPADLFATALPPNGADMGPGAAAVIAAGRALVAPPELHANPYVPWPPREARRRAFIAALADPQGDLCPFRRLAANAYFLLPTGTPARNPNAEKAFADSANTIWRVADTACRSGERGEDLLQRPQLVAPGR